MAANAGWDSELLRLELVDLGDAGFDLSLLGFSDMDLAGLMAEKTVGLTDPDDTPPVPANPVSVLGDVWILGRHRIVCGDCTDAEVVHSVLGDVQPHLMVTDPPYGVEYSAGWRNEAMPAKNDPKRWKDGWSFRRSSNRGGTRRPPPAASAGAVRSCTAP